MKARDEDMGPNGTLGSSRPTIAELESVITRIPSVNGARVVLSSEGHVAEVHVLASPDRSPKQLVRDVQSVAMASFGLEVDYRKVSVVQLEDDGPRLSAPAALPRSPTLRPVLSRLSVERTGRTVTVAADLKVGSDIVSGSASGSPNAGQYVVAAAILDCLSELLGDEALSVAHCDEVAVAGQRLALVLVKRDLRGSDQSLTGTAVVRGDTYDAAARATLSALNRIFSH